MNDWGPNSGRADISRTRFFNESHYMFTYWLVGVFFDDLETLSLAVGLIRSFESLGYCIAYGIGASAVSPMVNLAIAFAMFSVTIPATSLLVFMVPERPLVDVVAVREPEQGDESASCAEEQKVDPVLVGKAAVAMDGPHQ